METGTAQGFSFWTHIQMYRLQLLSIGPLHHYELHFLLFVPPFGIAIYVIDLNLCEQLMRQENMFETKNTYNRHTEQTMESQEWDVDQPKGEVR